MRRATRTRAPGPERQPSRPDSGLLGDVLRGLAVRPRSLPSQHLYDARGTRLFQWITNPPGYYLTRVEREILDRHGDELVRELRQHVCSASPEAVVEGQVLLRARLGHEVVPPVATPAWRSTSAATGRWAGSGAAWAEPRPHRAAAACRPRTPGSCR